MSRFLVHPPHRQSHLSDISLRYTRFARVIALQEYSSFFLGREPPVIEYFEMYDFSILLEWILFCLTSYDDHHWEDLDDEGTNIHGSPSPSSIFALLEFPLVGSSERR